jgi:hypothetical protein
MEKGLWMTLEEWKVFIGRVRQEAQRQIEVLQQGVPGAAQL